MKGKPELYRPRSVVNLEIWNIGHIALKIYGVLADGQNITDALLSDAYAFVVEDVMPRVEIEGDDNGLGFVIIHPGELGVSVLAHWWVQGCVLCQHIRRRLWGADQLMETATRPVIACVWELELIHAEQQIWRRTMMTAEPDAGLYLHTRIELSIV